MRVRSPDPFGWLKDEKPPEGAKPVLLNGMSFLWPMRRGAVLCWVFRHNEDEMAYLLVRLTEKVRKTLRTRGASLGVWKDGNVTSRRLVVPERGNEFEFVAELLGAADTVEEYVHRLIFSLKTELQHATAQLEAARAGRDQVQAEIRDIERRMAEAKTGLSAERDYLSTLFAPGLTPGFH
jgi:hypothetical protein